MTFNFPAFVSSVKTTAVLVCTAVVVVYISAYLNPVSADQLQRDQLAAELRIVRADLIRLDDETSLAPSHVQGLKMRISGALGILPWLLRQNGDDTGAARLRRWNFDALDHHDERTQLAVQLDLLSVRHPIDLSRYALDRVTATQKREARAIHDTYCAGCHDDAGEGDENVMLPARDLFLMSRESRSEDFLARLINGVKGDETLLFSNPLTARQITALWALYRK